MNTLRETLARATYSALLRLVQPAYVLRLWWRGRAEPLYRHAIAERFGHYRDRPSTGWVWVHAVSLGETRAAAALIDAMRVERPGMRLLLTHGTATGRETGVALLRENDRQCWLPYDTPGAVRRFLRQFRPAVGVLMETEIWPNLLHAAHRQGVTMVLANARLSRKSFEQGQRFASLLAPAADSVALVLAQTDDDAQRLRASGARVVEVSGNLKFDLTPDAAQLAQGANWRALAGRRVVLGAITREGEEAMLLAAWVRQRALGALDGALLVIVPRHPQRFDEVEVLVRAAGFTLARRSRWQQTPPPDALVADVWLGDSLREMALYYASAHVALLGGSFAPFGGHNLIEAAACACPLVMGPSTFNFNEAAELSLAAGASVRVADMDSGVAEAQRLLRQPEQLAQRAQAGLAFAAQHRGAAQRMARCIVPLMRSERGFTLIEMMVVVAVIAFLAMIAVPSIQDRLVREQIVEAVRLAEIAKPPIVASWTAIHVFPADNVGAGLPVADKIVSNHVKAVLIEDGAIHITFGNRAIAAINGKTLTLRPAVVTDAPIVPIAWVCGDAAAPDKMTLQGVNRTNVAKNFLPLNCRG